MNDALCAGLSHLPDFLQTQLNIRATTLEPIHISIREYLALFEHPLMRTYLGFVLAFLLVADPSHLISSVPLAIYVSAWVAAFVLYICVHMAILLGLGALRYLTGRQRPAIYWPLVSLLSFAPTLLAMETYLTWAAGDGLRPLLTERVWYLAATAMIFETFFLRFVLPRVAPSATAPRTTADQAPATSSDRTDPPAADRTPPQIEAQAPIEVGAAATLSAQDAEASSGELPSVAADRKIHIGAKPIRLGEVSVIEAREHHVHVRMQHGTLSQRARLSDIVAQTREEDGIQPHRSFWVPRHSVRELGRDGGKPVLRLTDESVIPVARGRLETVRRWITTHLM